MKTLRIFSMAVLLVAFCAVANAQAKTETFKVSGNCGMCKTKIEKAAKEAGAKSATWDIDSKILTITYKSSSTNAAKIQEKIASVGYDNAGATATNESYDKLHGCCKYERTAVTNEVKTDCCMKDGAKMDCCKDGKCTKEGHDGKDCCKKDGEKMDCCKDGKCSKEGHDGKDCCKKSE
jgi:periplasmic mercuric ion binding protein